MARYLGIDTSNYTTSVALYNSASGEVWQRKQLLPVKDGALGLRQSDAVFSHVKQLGALIEPGDTKTGFTAARRMALAFLFVRVMPKVRTCRAFLWERRQRDALRLYAAYRCPACRIRRGTLLPRFIPQDALT